MSERTLCESAACLLIGDELLSGKVADENLVELARTLRELGIRLARVVVIGDDRRGIAEEVRALSAAVDVVFTSGGIGPTHDDITIEGVADAFGTEAFVEPTLEAMLRGAYGSHFRAPHRRMALVPRGAELKTTADSAWPTVVMRNVWCLPGVPEAFRAKLHAVRAHLAGTRQFFSRAVFLRLGEGELAPLLDALVASHPEVSVGSYPKYGEPTYQTKVTLDGVDEGAVERALTAFVATLPEGEPQRIV